jgi:NAD(P)-dependent dehydrogenase (short-subunit alcohol dehydrogenase family)
MDTPTVLITGALTGIGRATALAFAQEGARVIVSGRHDDEGQKLATELGKLGTEAEFLRTDVRHEEEVKNLVDKTIARFGRLDIAVNNAGTGVRVNIVGPGPVETRMFNHFAQTKENKASFLDAQVPNKRIGTPEEIANAIVFIGSDKASYIIGASLAVDGGMIAD